MIQPDSLKVLKDSTKLLPSDSIQKLDTLLSADSTKLVDTIKAIIQAPSGHIGIPHPSLPQTDGWIFGTLLILFFLLVFSISKSSGIISETIKTFFLAKDHSNLFGNSTVSKFRFRFFLIEFSIGVISLNAYLYFQSSISEFSIFKYGYFLLATTVFFGIKSLLFDVLGYVFFDRKKILVAKESYFNIIFLLGIILYPILIFQIYVPYNFSSIIEGITLLVFVIAYIFVIIKLFQIFFSKIVASFYILLYLCTLEFLPLLALYWVYELIL